MDAVTPCSAGWELLTPNAVAKASLLPSTPMPTSIGAWSASTPVPEPARAADSPARAAAEPGREAATPAAVVPRGDPAEPAGPTAPFAADPAAGVDAVAGTLRPP